jgi:crossover junction endodeoxyribonuclease RuvC
LSETIKILGIDPGLNVTGYGIIQIAKAKEPQLLSYGTIRTAAKAPLSDRVFKIYDALNKMMINEQPKTIAIETIFYADNVKTAIVMGHARGAALVAARQNSDLVAEYSPREIKLAVTGTGGAVKSQVNFMVKNLLRVHDPIKPDDASDALAVAICHWNKMKYQ